jgi:hypothetical protein
MQKTVRVIKIASLAFSRLPAFRSHRHPSRPLLFSTIIIPKTGVEYKSFPKKVSENNSEVGRFPAAGKKIPKSGVSLDKALWA